MGRKQFGEFVTVIVTDSSNRKLDFIKFNGSDSKAYGRMITLFKMKYNWYPKFEQQKENDNFFDF